MSRLRTAGLFALAALALGCAPVAAPPAPVAAPSWLPLTAQDLLGTWKLTRVGAQPVAREFRLTFHPGGLVDGILNRGNGLRGGYRLNPHRILFIGLNVTERGCDVPPLLAAAEKSLLSPSSAYFSPDRRHLYLSGLETLRFTRAD